MKRKILAFLMATAIMVPGIVSLAGCNRSGGKEQKAEYVEADTPWFSRKYVEFEDPLSDLKGKIGYSNINAQCFDGDNLYVVLSYSDKDDYEKITYLIIKYDENGKIVEKRDLSNDKNLPKITGSSGYYFNYSGSSNKALVNAYQTNGVASKNWFMIYDIITGDVQKLDFLANEIDEAEGYIDQVIFTDSGKMLIPYTKYDYENDKSNSYVFVCDKDKVLSKLDLNQLMADSNPEYVGFSDVVGDNIIVYAYPKSSGDRYEEPVNAKIDINTQEVKVLSEEESDSAEMMYRTAVIDGNKYYIKDDGVYLKGDDGKMEAQFLFDNSNCETGICWERELVKAGNDSYTFLGTEWHEDGTNTMSTLTFTKCDSNPNVGKELIDLAYVFYTDDTISKAVVEFNEASDKYFIKTDRKYVQNEETFADSDKVENDDWNKYYTGKQADMTNELAMDLLAGSGPDIIVGAQALQQLQNEDYLLDLSSYYSKDIGDGVLFDNVINMNRKDGKLFNMPTCFNVVGIFINTDDFKPAGEGFTYAEYEDFVKNICNGHDPYFYEGQKESLVQLCNMQSDLFFDKDGKPNFKNEAFYETAKFCKDNIEEINYSESMPYVEDEFSEEDGGPKADSGYLSDFYSYIMYADMGGGSLKTLYGLPSYDGRGTSAMVNGSLAIAAGSGSKDGAWEFIKDYVSYDTQAKMSERMYSNSINVAACEKKTKDGFERINEERKNYEGMSVSGRGLVDPNAVPLEESAMTEYMDILKKADRTTTEDAAISLIIHEEIPAYFSGQKSIEDVADTIQNRASTVAGERG